MYPSATVTFVTFDKTNNRVVTVSHIISTCATYNDFTESVATLLACSQIFILKCVSRIWMTKKPEHSSHRISRRTPVAAIGSGLRSRSFLRAKGHFNDLTFTRTLCSIFIVHLYLHIIFWFREWFEDNISQHIWHWLRLSFFYGVENPPYVLPRAG